MEFAVDWPAVAAPVPVQGDTGDGTGRGDRGDSQWLMHDRVSTARHRPGGETRRAKAGQAPRAWRTGRRARVARALRRDVGERFFSRTGGGMVHRTESSQRKTSSWRASVKTWPSSGHVFSRKRSSAWRERQTARSLSWRRARRPRGTPVQPAVEEEHRLRGGDARHVRDVQVPVEAGVEHEERRLAAQRVVAGDHHLPQAGHPADARGRGDVVARGRPPARRGTRPWRSPAAATRRRVHPSQPGEEGRGPYVLAGHQPGERRAEVEEVAGQGLLFLIGQAGPVAPPEGVHGQHHIARAGPARPRRSGR